MITCFQVGGGFCWFIWGCRCHTGEPASEKASPFIQVHLPLGFTGKKSHSVSFQGWAMFVRGTGCTLECFNTSSTFWSWGEFSIHLKGLFWMSHQKRDGVWTGILGNGEVRARLFHWLMFNKRVTPRRNTKRFQRWKLATFQALSLRPSEFSRSPAEFDWIFPDHQNGRCISIPKESKYLSWTRTWCCSVLLVGRCDLVV